MLISYYVKIIFVKKSGQGWTGDSSFDTFPFQDFVRISYMFLGHNVCVVYNFL